MNGIGDPDRHAGLRAAAHDHADHLSRRVRALAADVARTEDSVARVLEWSAGLRPHAAERLREGARRARAEAELRREYAHRSRGGDRSG